MHTFLKIVSVVCIAAALALCSNTSFAEGQTPDPTDCYQSFSKYLLKQTTVQGRVARPEILINLHDRYLPKVDERYTTFNEKQTLSFFRSKDFLLMADVSRGFGSTGLKSTGGITYFVGNFVDVPEDQAFLLSVDRHNLQNFKHKEALVKKLRAQGEQANQRVFEQSGIKGSFQDREQAIYTPKEWKYQILVISAIHPERPYTEQNIEQDLHALINEVGPLYLPPEPKYPQWHSYYLAGKAYPGFEVNGKELSTDIDRVEFRGTFGWIGEENEMEINFQKQITDVSMKRHISAGSFEGIFTRTSADQGEIRLYNKNDELGDPLRLEFDPQTGKLKKFERIKVR